PPPTHPSLVESCVSIICACMPTIPAFSKLIAHNPLFLSLRTRLRSLYALSNRSKPSTTSSKRKAAFPSNKASEEFEPYIQLVESGGGVDPPWSMKSILHVPRKQPQRKAGD
ncbi:MAG: hypothetical protein Q9188_004403, partial [Gyalolechia gomerana]